MEVQSSDICSMRVDRLSLAVAIVTLSSLVIAAALRGTMFRKIHGDEDPGA